MCVLSISNTKWAVFECPKVRDKHVLQVAVPIFDVAYLRSSPRLRGLIDVVVDCSPINAQLSMAHNRYRGQWTRTHSFSTFKGVCVPPGIVFRGHPANSEQKYLLNHLQELTVTMAFFK